MPRVISGRAKLRVRTKQDHLLSFLTQQFDAVVRIESQNVDMQIRGLLGHVWHLEVHGGVLQINGEEKQWHGIPARWLASLIVGKVPCMMQGGYTRKEGDALIVLIEPRTIMRIFVDHTVFETDQKKVMDVHFSDGHTLIESPEGSIDVAWRADP